MKKIIILTGILIAVLLNSCQEAEKDFLDAPTKSTLDESLIFSKLGLAKNAIDGILEPMGQTNSYRGRFIPYYGQNTDTEWSSNSDKADDPVGDLCVYNASPTNSYMNSENNAWAMMYSGIERANICIRGIRTYGSPETDVDMGQLLGAALTYRAIYYADLMKAWGDVPARFEPITSETLYIAKSSRDDIYKQIIADLEEASSLVVWPNETDATATVERINKAFVKAFRARLAMAASGYQQYPDGIRRSNDPDLSVDKMYKIALDECRDVINSGKAHLEPTFEGLWRKLNEEDLSAGNESLWEIPFAAGRGRVLFSFAVKHDSKDQYTDQAKGGGTLALPTVFYDFDESDLRRDITCVPYKYGTAVDGIAKQELVALDTWYFGKYRYEWMKRRVTSTNDDGVNKIYMRYAEVLFIAAEAANELEGPAAAAPYLKELRKRAFPSDLQTVKVDNYVNGLGSKQDMFNALVKEHEYEFTGEMERKQALIRWNLLGTNLVAAKQKMTDLMNRTGEYADVPSALYYKYSLDEDGNETVLDIYGLNRGENVDPGAEYSKKSWTGLDNETIQSLFKVDVNPDDRQFWPIWQVFIDGSNNKLVNDYNY